MNKLLVQIIKDALNQSRNGEFKRAWIPRGWACVKVERFARELAKRLTELK